MLFFDQLLDNLGVGVDDWRQKAVRDALQPLRSLARELDIAALGCLHPNKRADSFRQLIAGAPAFNSVSRSSLLPAQHPEDEDLRVLVRGKGNLCQAPGAVEFEIAERRFNANGHEFKVPHAQGFHAGDLTIDDLLDKSGAVSEHSKVADACEIIEALLPHDGEWHGAKRLVEACAENGIDERAARRAKERLRIEHRRTETFPATVEWRWPSSQDTVRPTNSDVRTVRTVRSANSRNPLRGSSPDTLDTPDSADTTPECARTAADLRGRRPAGDLPGVNAAGGYDLLEREDDADRPTEDEAADFLVAELADGPKAVKDLERAAKEGGISARTLERARARLRRDGVIDRAQTGFHGGWEWFLHTPPKGDGGVCDGRVGGVCETPITRGIPTIATPQSAIP